MAQSPADRSGRPRLDRRPGPRTGLWRRTCIRRRRCNASSISRGSAKARAEGHRERHGSTARRASSRRVARGLERSGRRRTRSVTPAFAERLERLHRQHGQTRSDWGRTSPRATSAPTPRRTDTSTATRLQPRRWPEARSGDEQEEREAARAQRHDVIESNKAWASAETVRATGSQLPHPQDRSQGHCPVPRGRPRPRRRDRRQHRRQPPSRRPARLRRHRVRAQQRPGRSDRRGQ